MGIFYCNKIKDSLLNKKIGGGVLTNEKTKNKISTHTLPKKTKQIENKMVTCPFTVISGRQ